MILRVVSKLRNLLRYMLLDSLFLYLVLLQDPETNLLASQPKKLIITWFIYQFIPETTDVL